MSEPTHSPDPAACASEAPQRFDVRDLEIAALEAPPPPHSRETGGLTDADLRALALLATLGEPTLAALAAALQPLELAAGEALFADRGAAWGLCIVGGGLLHAVELDPGGELPVRVIGPGQMVGPTQTLAGVRHPVVVRAAEPTTGWCATAERLAELGSRFPELNEARERLDRRQLLCRLHPILGALDEAFLDDLEAAAEWKHVQRGQLLFEQGVMDDTLCFVVSGMLQTLHIERDATARLIAEAGRGDTVGELEFFTGARRGTRVSAIRDSLLVAFAAPAFEALVARRPHVLRRVTRGVVERVQRRTPRRATGRISNIAVVAATSDAPVMEFSRRLTAELQRHGRTLYLDAATVDEGLGGMASAQSDAGASALLLSWLETHEAQHRFVVYQADSSATPWTRRCFRRADRVLLVASAAADPRCSDVERGLLALEARITDAHEILVLVHENGATLPTGTAGWMKNRPHVEEHFHLRWNGRADVGRLARKLAGRQVGLVLGGGGARGFAHIGMLRELDEAGVPVDAIGGTSMGSIIAAQYAMGWSWEQMVEMNRRIFLGIRPHGRFTLPLLSLVNSRRIEMASRMAYGDTRIEDMWLPWFCVSSNLTTAEAMIHRQGPVWRAIMASSAIPGVDTPVLHEGQLLVDGALLNNVPTDVMRDLGCGTVIAAEVTVENDDAFTSDHVPTPWEVLRSRFRRGGPARRFPSLMEVLMRSSMLHSIYRQRIALQEADLLLRPSVEGYGLMDWDSMDELIEIGRRSAQQSIGEWREAGVCPDGS